MLVGGLVAAAVLTPSTAAAGKRTVVGELTRIESHGAITLADYATYRSEYSAAKSTARKLNGERRRELQAVIGILDDFAARGLMTSQRLPQLFETLERNRQWWTTGSLLSYGQRITFMGSRIVWEFFPGQGIQFHPLANFSKVNALLSGGFADGAKALLEELKPLAVPRAGGIAWEYDFKFGTGRPPWVSGIAEGTAVQSLGRAAKEFADTSYLDLAKQALGVFNTPPPQGVRVRTKAGAHYLIYSYSRVRVLNAFIQAVNGLYDLWQTGGVPEAQQLYEDGLHEAEVETPEYDTGAWSLYQPGEESPLSYHELVRDFLKGLCQRSGVQVFCTTATHFTDYLHQPPVVKVVSRKAKQGKSATLSFDLSKISTVGITLIHDGETRLSTSATFGHGTRRITWTPRNSGSYTVKLFARDLAGNVGRAEATILVSKAPARHHHRSH
jgi:D-glucuronyl C5-epimerase C-terminus